MTAVAIAFGGGIVLASMLGGKSSRRSRSVTSSYSHTPRRHRPRNSQGS